MGTIHINAQQGEIAKNILLPGDPLRAKYIAEHYLKNPVCYNQIRGMLGYTGTYKGKPVSVQGTGMGIPSISIYVHELIREFAVRKLIRIGSCGSIQSHINLLDIVIALAASTDSAINSYTFSGKTFAPTADAELIFTARKQAENMNLHTHAGSILTSDTFYDDDPDFWKIWAEHGTLCIEMETAALYTIAARNKVKALSLLTVSDNIITNQQCSPQQRQLGFDNMIILALETILNSDSN